MIKLAFAASLLAAAGPALAARDFSTWLSAELDRNMELVEPLRGKEMRGVARVVFRFGEDGRPTDVRLLGSSGTAGLDGRALRAVRGIRAAPAGHRPGEVQATLHWGSLDDPRVARDLRRAEAGAGAGGQVRVAARAGGRRGGAY